jgi:hypothetical protein
VVEWKKVRLGDPFECPYCGENITVPGAYAKQMAIINLLLTVAGAYVAGARNEGLAVVTLIAYFPMCFVWPFITRRIFPPTLVMDDPLRGRRMP